MDRWILGLLECWSDGLVDCWIDGWRHWEINGLLE